MTAASGADLDFTYNSATDVPVTASSYSASGSATLTLNFAPATGTSLTVVNNTGLGFISRTFSNLAQGFRRITTKFQIGSNIIFKLILIDVYTDQLPSEAILNTPAIGT